MHAKVGWLLGLYKLDGDGINAVPGVFFGQLFAFKYVPQMSSAVITDDLYAASVGVDIAFNRAGNLIVKTGPATAGGELVRRAIERRITLFTNEGAGLREVVVFAYIGALGALV